MRWLSKLLAALGGITSAAAGMAAKPGKPQPVPVTTEKDLGWDENEEPTRPDVPTKRGQA